MRLLIASPVAQLYIFLDPNADTKAVVDLFDPDAVSQVALAPVAVCWITLQLDHRADYLWGQGGGEHTAQPTAIPSLSEGV